MLAFSHVSLESFLTRTKSSASVCELRPVGTKPVSSPRNAVAPLRDNSLDGGRYDHTVEQAKILVEGCWLGKFTSDCKGTISNAHGDVMSDCLTFPNRSRM